MGRTKKPVAHTIFYTFLNNPEIFMTEIEAGSATEAVEILEKQEGTVFDTKVFEAKMEMFDRRMVGTR